MHLDQIEWTPTPTARRARETERSPFKVRLFKLVATNGDIDWVITNCPDETVTAQVAQDANDVRCSRRTASGPQTTHGSEKCRCRKARSHRIHLARCYHAWLSFKVKAKQLDKTLRPSQNRIVPRLLASRIPPPRIPAFQPA